MYQKIKNGAQLTDHGVSASRRLVLELTDRTLKQLDSYHRICSIASVSNGYLHIGDKRWCLGGNRRVYLLGAGKACNAMAMAVEDVLGDFLTDGVAVVKLKEPTDRFRKTRAYVGGHPLPNAEGIEACRAMLALVDQAGPDDLFISVMSGGSSALMGYPAEGLTLQDEIDATDLLLKSGARIVEINAVRRHISRVNGGRLAQRIAERGADLIGFNISDSVSNPPTEDISVPWPAMYGTPVGADQTTLADALEVIGRYRLADRMPRRVMDYLRSRGPSDETPKAFPRFTYYQLNTLPDSCACAQEAAREMGLQAVVLSTFVEGESREVGKMMAALAREIQSYGRPFAPPCVLLSAGEAVTTIPDSSVITGHGGPSQEMAIGFALAAENVPGACLLSIDTEGTDGTTLAAGGMTDSLSRGLAIERGVDLEEALRGHASHEALCAIGDAVETGNTGTNLCDLNILYVPARSS